MSGLLKRNAVANLGGVALYYLLDPKSKAVRYVGVSAQPNRRYTRHLQAVGDHYRDRWIRKLKKQGRKPLLRVVVIAQDREAALRLEVAAIARLSRLTNLTPGGDGVTGPAHAARTKALWANDPDYRRRQRESLKRYWSDPDRKKAQALRLAKQRERDPGFCARQRAGVLKVFATAEYRERRRAISKKVWEKPGHREKVSSAMKECWEKPEHRRHMTQVASEAMKEVWKRPEHRKKVAASIKAHHDRKAARGE